LKKDFVSLFKPVARLFKPAVLDSQHLY
jgi:hypothetical protein